MVKKNRQSGAETIGAEGAAEAGLAGAPPKPKEPKDAKFRRLAQHRMVKALGRVAQVGNLANRSQYTYTQEQAEKICAALEEAVADVRVLFNGRQSNGSLFQL